MSDFRRLYVRLRYLQVAAFCLNLLNQCICLLIHIFIEFATDIHTNTVLKMKMWDRIGSKWVRDGMTNLHLGREGTSPNCQTP